MDNHTKPWRSIYLFAVIGSFKQICSSLLFRLCSLSIQGGEPGWLFIINVKMTMTWKWRIGWFWSPETVRRWWLFGLPIQWGGDCYFAASSAGAGDTKMKSSIDFWLSPWKIHWNFICPPKLKQIVESVFCKHHPSFLNVVFKNYTTSTNTQFPLLSLASTEMVL